MMPCTKPAETPLCHTDQAHCLPVSREQASRQMEPEAARGDHMDFMAGVGFAIG